MPKRGDPTGGILARVAASLRAHPGPYWTLQVAGWTAFALVNILALLPSMSVAVVPRLIATKLTRSAWGLVASDLLRRIYQRLNTGDGARLPRLIAAAAALVALGPLWYAAVAVTILLWRPPGTPAIQWSAAPHGAFDSIVVLAAWSAAYFGVRAWRSAESSTREADAAKARADRAQLDALRYQLNPHFLFNALSSIRTLISEDQDRARAMVTGFADMLRHSLDSAAVTEVPLAQEIASVERYLAIERVRFESALDVDVAVEPAAEPWLVPTFLLQPLIENAIAHGRRSVEEPLRIRICATASDRWLRIEVANTGSLDGALAAPAGADTAARADDGVRRTLGVASVRQRLALRYADSQRFRLVQDGAWVRAVIEIGDSTPALER